jgi:hypothetical protein
MSDKFKGMTTVEFLYRYIFRGIGYVFLIGVITGLILFVMDGLRQRHEAGSPASATHERRRAR